LRLENIDVSHGTLLFFFWAKILAVDLSPDLPEEALKHGLPKEWIEFLENPFEQCDERRLFDGIIGSFVLHHLDCNVAFIIKTSQRRRFFTCKNYPI
jgi:2-polyprenyl-3-methyl-5-hydroxy-6-metoxy-1,4-benzoquinol methylase